MVLNGTNFIKGSTNIERFFKKWIVNKEAAFEGDTGNCVWVGVKASYKYITYDPLKRKPDGICSRKMKNTFCLEVFTCAVRCVFWYLEVFLLGAQNTAGTVPSATAGYLICETSPGHSVWSSWNIFLSTLDVAWLAHLVDFGGGFKFRRRCSRTGATCCCWVCELPVEAVCHGSALLGPTLGSTQCH